MQLMDPIAPVYEFGQRIFHSHAKDMRIDVEKLNRLGSLVPPMQRSTAKIPGLGEVDWGKYIGALADVGYDGQVCVEVEDHAFEGSLEKRRKSLEISYRVLRPLIA
jgi:sugar phosphate isomerase/epimerase